MKYVIDHLNELSGENYSSFNFNKLATDYAEAIVRQEKIDEANLNEYYNPSVKASALSIEKAKKAVAEMIDTRKRAEDDSIPVVSTFDAFQGVKEASRKNSRDLGLSRLATHLEKKWKVDRTGSLTHKDISVLKDHYSKNYPKSAASEALSDISKKGYTDLPKAELMAIAASIHSQEDFDSQMIANGLTSNSPRNVKSRQFILAAVNKKASVRRKRSQSVKEVNEFEDSMNIEKYPSYYDEESEELSTSLFEAVRSGDIEAVREAISFGEEITPKLLVEAVDNDQFEMVKFLVENGADIDSGKGFLALSRAALQNQYDMVDLLLNLGADVHANNDAAICNAAISDDLEMVETLLDVGADPNAQNGKPISVAVDYENELLFNLLIKYGAEVPKNLQKYIPKSWSVKKASVPEKWEKTVKKMKNDPEIDNPYALANWMENEGYTPGGKGKKEGGRKVSYQTHATAEDFVKIGEESGAEEKAQEAIGNWKKWENYMHFGDDDEKDKAWTVVYTDRGNQSGILDESNKAIIEKVMRSFNNDVEFTSTSHWAVGGLGTLEIRVVDDSGNITDAWKAWVGIQSELDDYPILDESDYSEREMQALYDNVGYEVKSLVDSTKVEDATGDVVHWLYENSPDETENTDDQGAYPDPDVVKEALIELGYLEDEEESEEEFEDSEEE